MSVGKYKDRKFKGALGRKEPNGSLIWDYIHFILDPIILTHPHPGHNLIFTKMKRYSDVMCEQLTKTLNNCFQFDKYVCIYLLLLMSKCIHILRTIWRNPLCSHPQLNPLKRKQTLLNQSRVPGSMLNTLCITSYSSQQRYETKKYRHPHFIDEENEI